MFYIGALTAAWTAMQKRVKEENLRIPNLTIYWLVFCLSFAISYLLLK